MATSKLVSKVNPGDFVYMLNLPIDTYLLGKNERARVALVADNPGVWMFHCHVIDHMETGLMAAIEVS